MRQVKKFPPDKSYKFGLGIDEALGGLRKRAGDFITEEEVKKYEVSERYLEKIGEIGEEKEDWKDEIPKGMRTITFIIRTEISGGNKEEKTRMIDQLRIEFKDYIKERGTVRIKVVNVRAMESGLGFVIG